MSIIAFKGSFYARLVALATLASFLATFLPARTAEASDADALGGVPIGSAGLSTVGSPSAAAGSPEALAPVDLSTGAAKTSYAFDLPTARGEAQPSLGLTYDSSSGVGFAGMG